MSQIISRKLAQDYKRFEKEIKRREMREWLKKNEKKLLHQMAKDTGEISTKILPQGKTPIVDPKKDLILDPKNPLKVKQLPGYKTPGGSQSILKDGEWIPVKEAKQGRLIKGFPKLTKKGWK